MLVLVFAAKVSPGAEHTHPPESTAMRTDARATPPRARVITRVRVMSMPAVAPQM
jgi:hypothetical protein